MRNKQIVLTKLCGLYCCLMEDHILVSNDHYVEAYENYHAPLKN